MQTAFDFLLTLVLKDHSKWKENKNEHGKGVNAHPNVDSKSDNNERKILTHHEIIDCIAEKILSVIVQVCKEIVDSSELAANRFLICLFAYVHLLLYCRYIDLHKSDFVKENKKPFINIKTTSKDKCV